MCDSLFYQNESESDSKDMHYDSSGQPECNHITHGSKSHSQRCVIASGDHNNFDLGVFASGHFDCNSFIAECSDRAPRVFTFSDYVLSTKKGFFLYGGGRGLDRFEWRKYLLPL